MLHQLVRYVLAPAARLAYRPVVHGEANVPARGPVILAANHRAVLDTAVISLVVRRACRSSARRSTSPRAGFAAG